MVEFAEDDRLEQLSKAQGVKGARKGGEEMQEE